MTKEQTQREELSTIKMLMDKTAMARRKMKMTERHSARTTQTTSWMTSKKTMGKRKVRRKISQIQVDHSRTMSMITIMARVRVNIDTNKRIRIDVSTTAIEAVENY